MPHTDGMTGKTRQLIKKIIYLAGITVAVYLGMRFALPIVIPFLLAILIARILCKPVAFLSEKTKLPKGIVSTAGSAVAAGSDFSADGLSCIQGNLRTCITDNELSGIIWKSRYTLVQLL